MHELLPNNLARPLILRPRGHVYELPRIRTERFKNSYINQFYMIHAYCTCVIFGHLCIFIFFRVLTISYLYKL